jgi:hypothetical protein
MSQILQHIPVIKISAWSGLEWNFILVHMFNHSHVFNSCAHYDFMCTSALTLQATLMHEKWAHALL